MKEINTIWVDINLGYIEYDDNDGMLYIPEIKHRIELTRLSRITSKNFMDNFNEIKFQLLQRIKEIIRELEHREKK